MISAISDYRKAFEITDKSKNILDIFFRSWEYIGNIYQSCPFLEDITLENELDIQFASLALEALSSSSIAKAENARSTLGSRGTEIMMGLLYQYYAGVDFEVNFGSAESAFKYSEGLRSRGFLEQMGTEAALKLPGIDPIDAQNVRDLIREIDNLREFLFKLDPQIEVERYATNGIALSKAEETLTTLDADISMINPSYAELRNPIPVSHTEAKNFCGDDQVIFEYVVWDSSVEFNAPITIGIQSSYQERPSINSYCLVITKK